MTRVAQFARLAALPGKGDDVLAALQRAFVAAEAETGTQAYVIHRSATDPDLLWMYEVYESPEAQQAHSRSDATAELRSSVAALLREPISVERGSTVQAFGLP